MTAPLTYPMFPPPREYPLDPPPLLRDLQKTGPIARVSLYAGDEAWVVTGFEAAKAVLRHEAFSSDAGRAGFPRVHPTLSHFTSGQLNHMDPPEHDVYRRMIAPEFSVKRVEALRSAIENSVDELIDGMLQKGPDVDLVDAFAIPVPALVICALLGVPYSSRDFFVQSAEVFLGGYSSPEQVMEARAALREFLGGLIEQRRVEPTEDLLGRVVRQYVDPGDLTVEQLVGLAELLLTAGFDTTHNMISLGVLALMQNRDQLAALNQDPGLVDSAVEEMLRYLNPVHLGGHRVATRDVEIEGHLFREGDGVVVARNQANRDPEVFPDPDRFDITRSGPHLTFGYGAHQCLGMTLARLELRVVFSKLFTRIPALDLAVPFEDIRFKHESAVYGCQALPVTWQSDGAK